MASVKYQTWSFKPENRKFIVECTKKGCTDKLNKMFSCDFIMWLNPNQLHNSFFLFFSFFCKVKVLHLLQDNPSPRWRKTFSWWLTHELYWSTIRMRINDWNHVSKYHLRGLSENNLFSANLMQQEIIWIIIIFWFDWNTIWLIIFQWHWSRLSYRSIGSC